MTNSTSDERERRLKQAPERIYLHPTSAEANINPWPLEPGEYVGYVRADLLTTIRQEERAAERKRVLDIIKRVPATAAGADAFRKRLIEELYVEAAANESLTREDGNDADIS